MRRAGSRSDVVADDPGNAIGGIVLGAIVSATFWVAVAAALTSLVR